MNYSGIANKKLRITLKLLGLCKLGLACVWSVAVCAQRSTSQLRITLKLRGIMMELLWIMVELLWIMVKLLWIMVKILRLDIVFFTVCFVSCKRVAVCFVIYKHARSISGHNGTKCVLKLWILRLKIKQSRSLTRDQSHAESCCGSSLTWTCSAKQKSDRKTQTQATIQHYQRMSECCGKGPTKEAGDLQRCEW